MPLDLPSIGHVIHFRYPYAPTALQAARQLQMTLAKAGAPQTTYGDREDLKGLTAPEPWQGPPPHPWMKWKRIWSGNLSILAQRDQWSDEETLIVYDPAHFPAIRSHQRIVFHISGKHWDVRSRRVRDRFRRFLNQLAWRKSCCVAVSETRWMRTFDVDAQSGEFRYGRVRPGVWHIPPFVDPDLFQPRETSGRFAGLNPVLYMGEMNRGAGFYLLADVFSRFAENHPDATLLVAGGPGGSKRLRTAMSVLERPGLAGRTMCLGDLPEPALPEVLASARMAVFPLLEERDTKIAALQAMASGAATLSTSAGGLDDLPTIKFEPTRAGLLQAMERAWPDADEMGLKQSAQVRDQFALANWEAAWLDLFRSLRPE